MQVKNKKYIGRITCLINESQIFKTKKYKSSISTFLYIVSAKSKKQAEKIIKEQFEETFAQKIEDNTIKVIIYNVSILDSQSGTVYFSFDAFLTEDQRKHIEKINWLS